MSRLFRAIVLILVMIPVFAQAQVNVEGYAYQEGNRGFLYRVLVTAISEEGTEVASAFSDNDGFFTMELPAGKKYMLLGKKEVFEDTEVEVSTVDKKEGDKVFVKMEMLRAPGYTFEITLAEQRDDINTPVDAIRGSLIEVYNNTKKEETLVLADHPHPDFKLDMFKGNHYTILIRKDGFLTKRMEAYVNVKGCILCFEGVGKVEPGIADNLTEGNHMGVLLANVELEKIVEGKTFPINNLYYDYGKATLKDEAIVELDKVITIFKDNPDLLLELGSHTDSRGKTAKNLDLSERRAQSAVNYLVNNGGVSQRNIVAKGYGESKLVNGCKNGVDCTEKQHALNRRTELKIVGILSTQGEIKSLAELKEQEQMDALLEELMNQEQVKVGDGQSLEDVVGKEGGQVEKKIKEKAKKEQGTEEIELEDFDPKKIKAEQRAAKKAKAAEEKRLKEEMEQKEERKRLAEEKRIEEMERKAQEEAAKLKAQQAVEKAADEVKEIQKEVEEIKEEKREAGEAAAQEVMDSEKNVHEMEDKSSELKNENKAEDEEIIKAKKLNISSMKDDESIDEENGGSDAKSPSDYDMPGGMHSIVIHFTFQPLPEGHKILKKHENVRTFSGINKEILYLIGEFEKREDAEKFLKSYLHDEYPNAYIIGIKEGKRYY